MRYFLPSQPLRPYVRRYALVESEFEAAYPVYPTLGAVFGCQYRGGVELLENNIAISLDPAGITGVHSSVRYYRAGAVTASLLVYFTPTGMLPFFGNAAAGLWNASCGLDAIRPGLPHGELRGRLHEAGSDSARIALVDDMLLGALSENRPDSRIRHATDLMLARHGNVLIGALARECFMSERAFERAFLSTVGVTPKKFGEIARFVMVAQKLTSGWSIARAGAAAGYHDQAHFTRDFARHTGSTPARFARAHSDDFLQFFPDSTDILEKL